MTSKEDDTLPLPAFSLEFSADVTADEDFIPTSQPLGSGCSKVSKSPQVGSNNSPEETNSSDAATFSIVNDTLQRETVTDRTTFDKDKSSDFIPDTETKNTKINYPKDELSCKKKLPIFGGDGVCQAQSSPLRETQLSQIPESPASDSRCLSVLNGSTQEAFIKCDKSIAEIIVNDSAETVDLEGSPMKARKSENEEKSGDKLSASCSISSNVGRCEETQIFDTSSVLLLEQQEPSTADREEESIKESTSEKLYLVKTVEDNESDLQEQENLAVSEFSPPAVAETSRNFHVKEELAKVAQPKEYAVPKGEPGTAVEDQTSVVTRKIDFKLTVTCFVTFNTKTNRILQKFISKVNETAKSHPKPAHFDHFSDNTSDKSKRYSTSSSGSVYSDKHGLPFALSKRISGVSDQTDSSEEDFGARMREKSKAIGRTPWSNEYLLPLKLDELTQVSIESQQIMERPSTASAMKELGSRRGVPVNRLRETSKSSSSEPRPASNVVAGESHSSGGRNVTDDARQTPETVESATPELDKTEGDGSHADIESDSREGNDEKGENSTGDVVEAEETSEVEQQGPCRETKQAEEVQATERSSVVLADGLRILARWTDKRYYPGVLCGSPKNDRWEVKFDDGTSKTVREDLIMPAEWLKVGSLVFALVDDEYVSGQIVDMERGNETTYAIELDVKKQKVSAKASDLCLTDVMAGIVREKYKPLAGTPRGKADIDFDNVLSGKRLRDQKTPSRPTTTAAQMGSSEAKKKTSSRKKMSDAGALDTIRETSETSGGGKRLAALKSEGGHLVEDKIASTESPSGNETGTTPLRRSKEIRSKAKPRTLSYGAEETRPGRGKSKSWLAADGTPIPGPSGVKFKRKKAKPKEDDPDEPPRKRVDQDKSVFRGARRNRPASTTATPESPERGKRKRRVEGSVEESIQKKMVKKGNVQTKGKGRKG